MYVLLDPENTVASVKAKYEKIQKRVMVEPSVMKESSVSLKRHFPVNTFV